MSVIITEGLAKHYGSRVGVDGVDLCVPEGCIYGFLGPNGAGKSTAIRLLLGFLRPTRGHATISGRDCWADSRAIKRDVGYVPGDLRLYRWMTARSALDVVGRIRGRDLRPAGDRLVDRFRLDASVKVSRMSRGMRQKLGLILALAAEPKLLVLDEPTTGLDPLMQIVLLEELRRAAEEGRTVFFSSHTLSEVETLCDRVAIVRDGLIVVAEPLDELRRRAYRVVQVHFATPADAERARPPSCFARVERRGRRLHCELPPDADVAIVLEWAQSVAPDDIEIGPPDLETVFQGYYRREESAS